MKLERNNAILNKIDNETEKYSATVQKAKELLKKYLNAFYEEIEGIEELENIDFSFTDCFPKLVAKMLDTDNEISGMKIMTINFLSYHNGEYGEKSIEYHVMVTDIGGSTNFTIEKVENSKFYIFDLYTEEWDLTYEDK